MHFEFVDLALDGVVLIRPEPAFDSRGYFVDVYRQADFASRGLTTSWAQHSLSFSADPHTVRGIHFQLPPAAQAKLVRVLSGAIMDVVVDLRRGSNTSGRYITLTLGSHPWESVYVPAGFGHGFCTLSANTTVQYSMSTDFEPSLYSGVNAYDPALDIPWPVTADDAIISTKDRQLPNLNFGDLPFHLGGDRK